MLVQAKDTSRNYKITLTHPTAQTLQYDGSEALSCKIWPGDDLAVVATPAAAWITAPDQVRVTIADSDLADLDPGVYKVRVYLGAASVHAAEETLKVLDAPGSGTALATYCSAEDLRRLYANVDDLKSKEDRAGFEEQRHLARQWLDGLLLDAYRNGGTTGFVHRYKGWGVDDSTFQGYLDDDNLILASPIVQACARYALSLIFEAQISADVESKTDYRSMAAEQLFKAEQIVSTYGFGIDTNADGIADLRLDLSGVQAGRG